MFILKSLYIYIYNFGLLIQSIIVKCVDFLFGGLIKSAHGKTDGNPGRKKALKKFSVGLCAVVLAAAVTASGLVFLQLNSIKTDAFAIMLDGEKIGCVVSRSDADSAEERVLAQTNSKEPLELTLQETKAEAGELISSERLFDILMQRLFPEYKKTVEVYIDGKLFCVAEDLMQTKAIFEEQLRDAKALYPTSSVAFAEEISFAYAYYKSSSDAIWSPEKLRLSLKTLGILTAQHTECEQTLSPVDFDTVEIETNTLFIGDSRVRREGKDGTEYVISLVTYNGDKKVLSQHLTSQTVTAPVSKVIERGMRAESLSMGSYTVTQTSGMFCWPVVGLYNVTSPFGYRSLGYHQGIDISGANASGSLVVAGASGTVVEAGWSTGGYGNYVKIDHGNGIETLYGHMLDNSLMVSVGDTVTKGQAIGRVGNTGYSFGAHLHFEVRINGSRVNPARYLGLE